MNEEQIQDVEQAEITQSTVQKESLPLLSELLAEQKQLLEDNDRFLKEMQEREYTISFNDKKVYNRLVKFLEKDAQWGHTTAAGLIMLYNNIRQNKLVVQAEDWDGNITLRAASVGIMWQMLMKMSGNGFFEARDFVELMANIGETVSKAYEKVNEDNQDLREAHTKLARVDQEIDEQRYIDDQPKDESSSQTTEDQELPVIETSEVEA
jgi:hypothetical protein